MTISDFDARVRAAAFDWVGEQVDRIGDDVLPWQRLRQGFELDGQRIPLVSPQGIFKPRVLDLPLSILTSPSSPYPDHFDDEGFLRYAYQGTDPSHRDNVLLRRAMREEVPLLYLFGVTPGKYLVAWPVFVVGDHQADLQFSVAVDDTQNARLLTPEESEAPQAQESAAEPRRAYVTAIVRRRLHQRTFRERVLDAYRRQCSLCRFRHEELLDAAHIIPDSEKTGDPDVSNGLSLCRLHHAAFDRHFIGIRPDYTVDVRADLLDEQDGPTLVHGIQKLHGSRIVLPRNDDLKPDPDRLAVRFKGYQRAAKAS